MASIFQRVTYGLFIICLVYLCDKIYWENKQYNELEEVYNFLEEDIDSLYKWILFH